MNKNIYSIITTLLAIPVMGLVFFAFTAQGQDVDLNEKAVEKRDERPDQSKKIHIEEDAPNPIATEDPKPKVKYRLIKNHKSEDLHTEEEGEFFEHEEPIDTKLKEDVSTISKTIRNIDKEGHDVKREVKYEIEETVENPGKRHTPVEESTLPEDEVKKEVKAKVISEKTKNEVANIARELNRSIEDTLKYRDIVDEDKLEDLKSSIDRMFDEIEKKVEAESGNDIDLSLRRQRVKEKLDELSARIDTKRDVIKERGGELLFKDSDGDGLSDYDETYIYKTDPENAFTKGGDINDREKIELGINPTSENEEKIRFENPKEDKTSVISDIHNVTALSLKGRDLEFKGKALPNSLVTLYIFSTPIVVTIKADDSGEWSYTLSKELENGDHEVFVATVDNTGKIVARSEGIPFVKTAEAATINVLGNEIVVSGEEGSFLQENLISIIISVLLLGFLLILIVLGRKNNLHDELN